MEQTILEQYLTQGIFAVLFIWLLFTVKRENAEREQKLQTIITEQTAALNKFGDIIKVDLHEIKAKL